MLPILEFLPKISSLLADNKNVVLQAEPGAGKSTALPLSLINSAWLAGKKIVMLEPRRVAAKSIAHYLAKQLRERVGESVGYHIKNDKKSGNNTILEIVTEGILTKRIQHDPELTSIGLLIFDEFHLRSLQSDLSLMLALEVQQSLRDDLRLLVMSATIDTQQIASYLQGASIVTCPGRQYPVEVSYQASQQLSLGQQVAKALKRGLITKAEGDILVFLPGQAAIKYCLEDTRLWLSDPTIELLPLYGDLSIDQQEKVLTRSEKSVKRIIFTTNIAETSLTIEGVNCVIDSGLEKGLVYDPVSNMTRLDTNYISQASAKQRTGRAGRLKSGSCIRLWSESKQQSLTAFQLEEIRSADLSQLVLELYIWGVKNYDEINWITPPPLVNFKTAVDLLSQLFLLDEQGKVTATGKVSAALGVEPRLAAMLLSAEDLQQQTIACELAALLSAGDIFYKSHSVDINERMIALQDYKQNKMQALNTYPLKKASVEQLLLTSKSLKKQLEISLENRCFNLQQLQGSIGRLLLKAYPDRLAKSRSMHNGRYLLANGRGVSLRDEDTLFSSPWLVVSDCNAQKQEGQIYFAAEISPVDVEHLLKDKIEVQHQVKLDEKKQKLVAKKHYTYQSLTIKEDVSVNVSQQEFNQYLPQLFESEGLSLLNWTTQCELWLARVIWLTEYIENFPKYSKQSLLASIDDWLLPYLNNVHSVGALKKANVMQYLQGQLSWQEQQLLEQHAPLHYQTPSGKQVPINYSNSQAPTVSIILQELFGEIDSPKLANNKVPLRFELLSPARRPIQTTSDLANFWLSSYFEVAKEMRGRYPKHRWPEKPLEEKPGKSFKPRKRK